MKRQIINDTNIIKQCVTQMFVINNQQKKKKKKKNKKKKKERKIKLVPQ